MNKPKLCDYVIMDTILKTRFDFNRYILDMWDYCDELEKKADIKNVSIGELFAELKRRCE